MNNTSNARRVLGGRPAPSGAMGDVEESNFALFSVHAEKVDLCLFHPTEYHEVEPGTLYGRLSHPRG